LAPIGEALFMILLVGDLGMVGDLSMVGDLGILFGEALGIVI